MKKVNLNRFEGVHITQGLRYYGHRVSILPQVCP